MTDKKPTEEQVREFWEWCGWKFFPSRFPASNEYYWEYPGEPSKQSLPILDLNNLFKYAVPKEKCVVLTSHYNGWLEQDGYAASIMWDKMDNVKSAIDNDPALALFWAIWEVIHSE